MRRGCGNLSAGWSTAQTVMWTTVKLSPMRKAGAGRMPVTQCGSMTTDGIPLGEADFRQARCPTRVYRGVCGDGGFTVTVVDSALGQCGGRSLEPATSRSIRDCAAAFQWGETGDGARQLALALLLDVSGDAPTALKWFEVFAEKYVRRLPPEWTVPELDIALWLHCYENARADA